jgi:polyhydroxybutyrate depolymerase
VKRITLWALRIVGVLAALAAGAWAVWLRPVDITEPPSLTGDFQRHTTELAGRSCSYGVYLPRPDAARQGVIVVLHGSLGNGEQFRRWTGRSFDALADRLGVAVVYPDGWKGHWNDCRRAGSYAAKSENVDDVAFIEQVVSQVTAGRPTRVGVVGYSNGGSMALRWALEGRVALDGLVLVASSVPAEANMLCRERRPVPTAMLIAGTADRISPYAGGHVRLFGSDRGDVRSAEDSARWLAGRGATEAPTSTQAARRTWTSPQGTRAELITLQGGGHTVPQARTQFPKLLGATDASVDTAELAAQTFGWAHKTATPETTKPTKGGL